MFAAGAVVDAISLHPYSHNQEYDHMRYAFELVDRALNAARVGQVRLVASEFGASSEPHGYRYYFPEQPDGTGTHTSADRILAQLGDLNAHVRGESGPSPAVPRIRDVDAAILFSAVEFDPNRSDKSAAGFGWFRRSVELPAASSAARLLPGPHRVRRLVAVHGVQRRARRLPELSQGLG